VPRTTSPLMGMLRSMAVEGSPFSPSGEPLPRSAISSSPMPRSPSWVARGRSAGGRAFLTRSCRVAEPRARGERAGRPQRRWLRRPGWQLRRWLQWQERPHARDGRSRRARSEVRYLGARSWRARRWGWGWDRQPGDLLRGGHHDGATRAAATGGVSAPAEKYAATGQKYT
jgi:hypothetical protein